MFDGMLKSMAATAAFGAFHSATASDAFKDLIEDAFGERARNAFARPLYIVGSVASLGALAAFIRRQPSRVIWKAHGLTAVAMGLMQAGWLAFAAAAAHEVGITKMLGLDGMIAFFRGDDVVPREPEAQGPKHERDGMDEDGPFHISQHPLNFAFLPILWLFPTMTTRLLGFSLAGSLYLWLGSFHEAARLRRRHGEDYELYIKSDIPFFAPVPDFRTWKDALRALV